MTYLMSADDSATLANDDGNAIARICQSYGLKIYVDKTKVLTTDASPATVHLDGC